MSAQPGVPSCTTGKLLIDPSDPRRPILDALDRFAEKLAPVAAALSGGKPLSDHTIEKVTECIGQTISKLASDRSLIERAQIIWAHSRKTAFAAQTIARGMSRQHEPPMYFLAGLLHDVGKLALLCSMPRSYKRVFGLGSESGLELQAERGLLGLDHPFAGRHMALGWNLPRPIEDSIGLHHTPSAALPFMTEYCDLVRVIQVANAMAKSIDDTESSLDPFAVRTAVQLGLAPEFLTEVGVELRGLEFKGGLIRLDSAFSRAGARRNEGLPILELPTDIPRFDASTSFGVGEPRSIAVMAEFAESIHSTRRLDLACLKAAEAARVLFRAPWTCCLYFPRSTGAGWALRFPRDRTSVHTGGWPKEAVDSLRGLLASSEGIPVPISLPSGLIERLFPMDSGEVVRLLPLGAIDIGLAGILIAGGPDGAGQARIGESEDSAVHAMLVTALTFAVKQLATEAEKERAAFEFEQGMDLSGPASQSADLSKIAELAAGAAHELNNPLAVISGRAQLELLDAKDPHTTKSLQTIVDQANKATGLISELMDFAKPQPPIPALLMLADVLLSVVRRRSGFSTLPEGAIEVTLADSKATLFADPGQMERAVDAILSNAIAACPPGAIEVKINSPSRASDDKVRIVIEDRGTGMTPYVLEHATIPFYSQRPAGRGRGLGLSLATRLIELNGGSWRIDSRPGTGTRVSITLPARQGE